MAGQEYWSVREYWLEAVAWPSARVWPLAVGSQSAGPELGLLSVGPVSESPLAGV